MRVLHRKRLSPANNGRPWRNAWPLAGWTRHVVIKGKADRQTAGGTGQTDQGRLCSNVLRLVMMSLGSAPALINALSMLLTLSGLMGCGATEGKLGIITTSSTNFVRLLSEGQPYDDRGYAKGSACHYHVLLIPFGNSDISLALDDALADTGSDAVIHVTTSKWVAGIPFPLVRSLFEMSCTTVEGTAIKFQSPLPVSSP